MLEYAALTLLIVMVIFAIYLIIYIHDIPYEIAKKRGHPHQDAIHIQLDQGGCQYSGHSLIPSKWEENFVFIDKEIERQESWGWDLWEMCVTCTCI